MSNLIDKLEQIKALKNGKGLQYLLIAGCKMLGNPIYIHDIDCDIIANTGEAPKEDTIWNELVTFGGYSDESIEFFKEECFIDAVANTKTITFLISDKLKYNRMLGKIFNKDNITVAFAHLVACNKSFESNDPIIFETLCKKLSKEIYESDFYQAYGEMHLEAVINELINGSIKDKGLYTQCVAEVYNGLKNYLYIAVADFTKCESEHTQLTRFKNEFKQSQPTFKYVIYENHMVILMSSNSMTFYTKRVLGKLYGIFEQNNIHVGISSSFENLFELPIYYAQAVNALNTSMASDSGQLIFQYNKNVKKVL